MTSSFVLHLVCLVHTGRHRPNREDMGQKHIKAAARDVTTSPTKGLLPRVSPWTRDSRVSTDMGAELARRWDALSPDERAAYEARCEAKRQAGCECEEIAGGLVKGSKT